MNITPDILHEKLLAENNMLSFAASRLFRHAPPETRTEILERLGLISDPEGVVDLPPDAAAGTRLAALSVELMLRGSVGGEQRPG